MAIKKITKEELRQSFKVRMEALAARHGMLVQFGEYDEFHASFREAGARYCTSAIATEFSYPRHMYGRGKDGDVMVRTFVVSGKFLERKENSALMAETPWNNRYVKTADYDKAIAALESTTRRDDPKERVETAALEASARWRCNEWNRRHPGCDKSDLYLVAEALDGRWPAPSGNDVDDVFLRREIKEHIKQRDHYVGEWMAVEIIDISRKAELESLGLTP